jgi:PAS domain S-box-containing protein
MDKGEFYELILDNITDGIYILDDSGNYVFVNSTYIKSVGMSKSELLKCNVHNFLDSGHIDFCISDIVYREKRRVVMFQDVYQKRAFRQLVISNPIFNQEGNVQNIVAIVKRMDTLNDYYNEASNSSVFSTCSLPIKKNPRDVIAASQAMKNILSMTQTIAEVDSSVLISGESGTGKEVIAQFIHDCGQRSNHPMVIVNCAALPENLLEAELFGYEKGSFTGASSKGKIGLIEAAEGGSLFLDEINSLPLPLQGKLLRAIETKTIQRIGSNNSHKIDFRIIAATNENLHEMVDKKLFRNDLFYRLNVIPITIPPLRDRKEDIIPLAMFFLKSFCEKYMKTRVFTEKTIQTMQKYNWPGNVRELKNFVERSVIMTGTDYIEIENVHLVGLPGVKQAVQNFILPNINEENALESENLELMLNQRVSLNEYLERCEMNYLQYALNTCNSSYEAADILQTSQSLIMRRKKKYGL